MIHQIPRFFFILTWVLIGPTAPTISAAVLIGGVLTLAIVLRRSFSYRTIALLSVLGIMVLDSLQSVFVGLTHQLFEPRLFHEEIWNFFSTLFTLNLGLSIVGVLAAICAAAYIEFGRSRMSIARIFPELRFLDAPSQLRSMMERLCSSAGIHSTDLCLIDSGTPSAFTIRSKRRYIVAVSVGLLESLDNKEVEACLAHEISHLKNNDFTWRFLATIAKVALFAKPLSYLIEPAVYRAREFLADRTAAMLIGGPNALISALFKLGESQSLAISGPSGTVCMCNLSGGRSLFKILAKHPDIEARIKALQKMSSA